MDEKQMNEKRLIAIASEICKTDDLLWAMGYITTLDKNDTDLLFQMISGYTSEKINFYDALVLFSHDYLKQRNIVVQPQIADFSEYSNIGDVGGLSYFERMLANDSSIKKVEYSKRR